MDCSVTLQISNYNTETNKVDVIPKPLGSIDATADLDIDYVVNLISKKNLETRSVLAAQLRAAKAQKVTEEMLKKYTFVSNASLNDLTTMYPTLANYNIPNDLQFKFTLLRCKSFEINGYYYHGRIVNSKTNEEIYVVNNYYDAEKLFKHLAVRLNLSKFIQGNTLDDKLKSFEEDLKVVSSRYKKNIQKLVEDFLINKQAYKSFRVGDRLYNPVTLINKVLSTITGNVYDSGDKSDMQMALESIKEKGSTSNEWKLDKKKLYEVLCTFYSDFGKTYTYNQFKDLSTEALNSIVIPLFSNDVKLMRATIQSSTTGETVVKESLGETKTTKLPKHILETFYKNRILPLNESLPKKVNDGLKQLGYDFITLLQSAGELTYTDPTSGETYPVKVSMDSNYKVTLTYEAPVKPVVTEKPSYVTINLHNWDPIGDIYGWGYEHQPLFIPTEEYKGFYIYEYNKEGTTHYAISRSIISPKSFMKTFSSLDRAKEFINSNKDTLREYGLWSIKQHDGTPRVTKLEMGNIREGQIVTTLDIKLPNVDIDRLSSSVADLLDKSLDDFYTRFNFVENIKSLDTPEKAVAFLYLTHNLLNANDVTQEYLQVVKTNIKPVQDIIKTINSAPKKSFYVEKANIYNKKNDETGRVYANTYNLVLLRKDGVDIDISGTFEDFTVQDFLNQNLTELANFYRNNLGVDITALSKSELELFSRKHNLKLENKLDAVRAFVYNGKIYLNTSVANASDLFHELAHIVLGSLKVSDPEIYSEIIKKYESHRSFDKKLEIQRRTYEHYSYQDIVEETVADLIAADMFKLKHLGSSDVDEIFITAFNDILNKSKKFVESKPDNKLGFSNYIKFLIDENADKVQRNMRVTELVRRYISEGKIKEECL